ncbi:MAG: RES family NAD+ phosphorylase [Flavisolibacter sp.]|nr:RES family NAD+ phosphorylase [Flavisolibacter sp.]
MIVYRLSKEKFYSDLSGKGAELYGGRWNSKGVAMLYTSQSRALAFAEVAIHIPVGIVPKDYFLVSINIPDTTSILKLTDAEMPADWRSNPHSSSTQNIGDQFIAGSKFLVLQVPSAVVPGDFNFLINPNHPQSKEVVISNVEPFEFDSRFVAKGK